MSFSPINAEDIQISSDSVISTLWSNDQTILTNFFTSTEDDFNYLKIYNLNPNTNDKAETQFSINYGNASGSGSQPLNQLVPSMSPSRITYGQIRTLIYGDENKKINFGIGNTDSEDFYIINIERDRYKEKLFLDTFNLKLTNTSGSLNLTNNSKDSNNINYCDAGRIFDIVSGSNGNSILGGGTTTSGSYGKFLPDVGMIILNPNAMVLPSIQGGLSITIDKNQTEFSLDNNNNVLYNLIKNGSYFSLNSEETITSNFTFIRVKNNDYNYTTNPSIINSNGEFYHNTLINNPQTYITTVGLYNDSNELLAVAKLSKPLKKDFTKEALLRVRLDF
jgi:hypothetical protein